MIPDQAPLYSYRHTMRSRYGETDKMGYVYYGRYLEYFEVARTEMIRSIGVPYRTLEEQGVMLPVIESHVKYKAPLYYDDEIVVVVELYEMPAVRLQTYYRMYTRQSDKLRAEGVVHLCFVNADDRKPCRAPRPFLNKLKQVANS